MTAQPSRRDVLMGATLGAVRSALAIPAGGLLSSVAARTANVREAVSTAVDGAQVAWIWALTTKSVAQLIGIAPSGAVVGRIDATNKIVLRAPDGTAIYTIATGDSSTPPTATALVRAYSALTGALRMTIESGAGANTLVNAALSPDGRYLALLDLPEITYSGNGTYGAVVDVIDLFAGRPAASRRLVVPSGTTLGGGIEFGPSGSDIYAFTYDHDDNTTITAVRLDRRRLIQTRQATGGQRGHVIPPWSLFPARILPDGKTLVFLPYGTVQWLDLTRLTVSGRLAVRPATNGAKPPDPAILFSNDGRMLYIANAATGFIQAIDLHRRVLTGTVTLSASRQYPDFSDNIGDYQALALVQAALSTDGTRLYAFSGGIKDGVQIVRAPELRVVGHALRGVSIRAVWPSPDGQTVYAIGLNDASIFVLDHNGRERAMGQPGIGGYDFVLPAA